MTGLTLRLRSEFALMVAAVAAATGLPAAALALLGRESFLYLSALAPPGTRRTRFLAWLPHVVCSRA